MSSEDTTLWHSFTGGNRDAFETIYRHHFDMLYEYGMRKLDNDMMVRDTIQELFIKLWANRKNIRATDNIKYYLLASFKNTLLNARVHEGRRALQPLSDLTDKFYLHFNEPGFIQEELQRRQSEKLTEALNHLSDRQKEVIYLRYFEELDYDRIAELMNISVGGVYKLHYRALDALKEILHLSHKDLLFLLMLYKLSLCHA